MTLSSINAKKALVINDGRGQAGLVAAERLLEQGITVEILTSDYAVAADLDPTHRNAWYERLGKAGVQLSAQLEVTQIDEKTVHLENIFSHQVSQRNDIDLVIDWYGAESSDELLHHTPVATIDTKATLRWFSAGDCLAPRTVEVAMAEALAIAQQLQ